MTTFVYGCDPELFVKRDGIFQSGFGLIPGTKEAPHKVDKGAVQVDGMALELNIEPASNVDEFVGNLAEVMRQLKEMVPEFEVVATPVAEFGAEYLSKQPLEAKELGCDPDFNAWEDGDVNPRPDGDATFRTGAGHIHIGWTNGENIRDPEHLEACIALVKQLDCSLGLLSVLFDGNTQRRQLYGKAGAFRPKHYGVEYRVLSNCWLESEELTRLVYKVTEVATNDLMRGVSYMHLIEQDRVDAFGVVTTSIDQSEEELARDLLEYLSEELDSLSFLEEYL